MFNTGAWANATYYNTIIKMLDGDVCIHIRVSRDRNSLFHIFNFLQQRKPCQPVIPDRAGVSPEPSRFIQHFIQDRMRRHNFICSRLCPAPFRREVFRKNNTYLADQRKNFLHMKQDFEQYLKKCV